ncbi:hypothetical protein VQ574_21140 (plasmid) [Stutzerimonas frequens]|uniref:hypothetical protein n=1 Tax=Stutzerimonas frequens TaxID=2968969 RepID=UPI002DBF4F61|nr:hypothetical protein [Stutzerimonas frequens]WRW29445.1 hypothetical protein VQ574_21140 [Stutzerimonas frequens]
MSLLGNPCFPLIFKMNMCESMRVLVRTGMKLGVALGAKSHADTESFPYAKFAQWVLKA